MEPDIDKTFFALADKQRRTIVEMLGEGPQRPSQIAAALGIPRPALSRHLKVLREAGFIQVRDVSDDARGRSLALRREPVTAVRNWLEQVEAFWEDQLLSFKNHAEKKTKKRQ
ncbi:MAG: winged helix-turn-helix transcriptional regulator [Polyangiaceae bacterium]|nr:winged helix-turn-helix transcriptional regulator [Polyangiaceae bacterium]